MAMESNSPALSQQPVNIRKSIKVVAKNINTGILIASDFAVDKVAITQFEKEVEDVHEDKDQRKELDDALGELLNHYFGTSIGPMLAYGVCLSATLSSRYSFDDYEPPENTDEPEGKEDESTESVPSKNGANDGKARTRKNDNPKGNSSSRNKPKSKPRKKRAATPKDKLETTL